MSTTTTGAGVVASVAPVTRRVRAYFAPVNRSAGAPTLFDPAQFGRFALDAPPAPWVDLGWVSGFARKCATKVDALRAGAPAVTVGQVRTEIDATVSLEFEVWGKLQVTLASGSQQTNLLTTVQAASTQRKRWRGQCAGPLADRHGTGVDRDQLECGHYRGDRIQYRQSSCGGCRLHRPAWICRHGVSIGLCAISGRGGQRRELCAASDAECRGSGRDYGRRTGACKPFAGGGPDGGDAGEPACRLLRSRRRELLSGVVSALCDAGRSRRSGSVSLSASTGDAGFG